MSRLDIAFDDRLGRLDAAVENRSLPRVGPASGVERFAGEVNDRIRAVECGGQSPAGATGSHAISPRRAGMTGQDVTSWLSARSEAAKPEPRNPVPPAMTTFMRRILRARARLAFRHVDAGQDEPAADEEEDDRQHGGAARAEDG